MPSLSLVVAVARNGVIGRDNGLAWRLRSDLRRFRALTLGKPILMGRKTFASLGKALPGRLNIVLTRDAGFSAPDTVAAHGWEAALTAAGEAPELMIVGGAEIYRLAMPQARRIHLTEVDAAPDGDTLFPAFDRAAYRETFRQAHPAAEQDEHPFSFVDLERLG